MSAPRGQTNSNDNGRDDHADTSANSSDGVYQQEIVDPTQFSSTITYHTDVQRSDTETDRSRVLLLDDVGVEAVQSLQIDSKRRTVPTAQALAALSSQDNESSSIGTNIGQHRPDRLSTSNAAAGHMFPPLNRAYMLHRDFLRPTDVNSNSSTGMDGVGISPSAYASDGVHFSDTTLFSAAVRRYIDDVKPNAPSSVKSFGSNVGSDDCGGSLDVETHSIGARSNHSQEDILPVAMPDPDPETVAVASLSLNSVDNGEIRNFVGNMYKNLSARQQHSRYTHLPLQRFHNNQVQFGNTTDDGAVENEDFENSVGNDSHSFSPQHYDHRTPLNWNDPRIDNDESTSDSIRRDVQNSAWHTTPRSRSRSRSPPVRR